MRTGSPAPSVRPPSSTSRVVVRMKATTGVVQRSISSTARGRARLTPSAARPDSDSHWPGVLGEADQATRHHVAGGLVAGHQELDEEHPELGVGQPVPLDLGRTQLGDDVVPRRDPPVGRRRQQVRHHVAAELGTLLLGPVGGPGDDRLRPPEERRPLLFGHPEQVADHLEGQRHGQLGHHVDRRCRARSARPGPVPGAGSPARAPACSSAGTRAGPGSGSGCGRAGRCASWWAASAYSLPISKVMIPFDEQNVAGSRDTATTSSWRLTIHRPRVSLRATGASARRRAYSGNGSPA